MQSIGAQRTHEKGVFCIILSPRVHPGRSTISVYIVSTHHPRKRLGIHHKRCNYCNVIWKNSPKNNELTHLSQRIDALSDASETKTNGKGKIFPASRKPIIFSEEKPGTWYKTTVNTRRHIDSSYSYNSSRIAVGYANTLRYCCTKVFVIATGTVTT